MSNDPFSPDYQGVPPLDPTSRDKPQRPSGESGRETGEAVPPPPVPLEPPPPFEASATPARPEPQPSAAVPPPPPPPPVLAPYPMRYEVEYPESLSRWKTLLRIVLALPLLLFLWPLALGLLWPPWFASSLLGVVAVASGPAWVAVFLKRKYPRWMFAWLSGFLGFAARAQAYMLLLTDRYPSFDPEDSPVTLEYDEPPSGYLSRWRVFFWKAALLIPHAVVLVFLGMAVSVVVLLSWFAILFTGRYPRGMFAFVTGANRWTYRLAGYFASFNDRYPPFAFGGQAGPASPATTVICGIIGWIVGGLYWVLIVAAVASSQGTDDATVDYDRLVAGTGSSARSYHGFDDRVTYVFRLTRAEDPADDLAPVLTGGRGQRLVAFEWTLKNTSDRAVTMDADGLKLKYEDGGDRDSVGSELLVVGGIVAPARVEEGTTVTIRAVFAIPDGATPVELRIKPPFAANGGIKYTFD